jgi:hypothetical protein
MPSARWFSRLYDSYDAIADALDRDPGLLRDWDNLLSEWQEQDNNKRFYCNVPFKFKDRAEREGKRDKSYLQFCADFWRFQPFKKFVYDHIPSGICAFESLDSISGLAAETFGRVVGELNVLRPGIIVALEGGIGRPAVIVKALRYNPNSERLATGPHFDKSALSIIVASDDREPLVRIGVSGVASAYSAYTCPLALDKRARTDVILINGLCLSAVGIEDMEPTPHSVLSVKEHVRHSVVSFLLVPYLDTSAMSPKAPFINDIPDGVR